MRGAGFGGQANGGGCEDRARRKHGRPGPKGCAANANVLPHTESRLPESHAVAGVRGKGVIHRRLHRHHRVGAGWDRGAGHDSRTAAGRNRPRGHVARREIGDNLEFDDVAGPISHVDRADREAVHHCPVPRRRIDVGDHGLGKPPARGIEEPLATRRQPTGGLLHQPDRVGEVDHAATVLVRRKARSRS